MNNPALRDHRRSVCAAGREGRFLPAISLVHRVVDGRPRLGSHPIFSKNRDRGLETYISRRFYRVVADRTCERVDGGGVRSRAQPFPMHGTNRFHYNFTCQLTLPVPVQQPSLLKAVASFSGLYTLVNMARRRHGSADNPATSK